MKVCFIFLPLHIDAINEIYNKLKHLKNERIPLIKWGCSMLHTQNYQTVFYGIYFSNNM